MYPKVISAPSGASAMLNINAPKTVKTAAVIIPAMVPFIKGLSFFITVLQLLRFTIPLPAFVFSTNICCGRVLYYFVRKVRMWDGWRSKNFGKSILIDVLLVASFSFDYDSKLPIVLFVGQCFLVTLFE